MSVITRMRKQSAVYWPLDALDAFGQPTWGTPVEIECRWEDSNEQIMLPNGETIMSRATVYVDRDTPEGGLLMLGELSSSVDEDDPKKNAGVWEIRKFDKLPNFRNTEFLRTVYL